MKSRRMREIGLPRLYCQMPSGISVEAHHHPRHLVSIHIILRIISKYLRLFLRPRRSRKFEAHHVSLI